MWKQARNPGLAPVKVPKSLSAESSKYWQCGANGLPLACPSSNIQISKTDIWLTPPSSQFRGFPSEGWGMRNGSLPEQHIPVSYEESKGSTGVPCCKVQRSDYWEELASLLANTWPLWSRFWVVLVYLMATLWRVTLLQTLISHLKENKADSGAKYEYEDWLTDPSPTDM